MFLNKLFTKERTPEPVDPDTWFRKVYDAISELELWSKKLSYEEYLNKINEYSRGSSKIPSEQDLQNPAQFTRVIFIAMGENLIYAGGFDYEFGYDDLFETLDRLFKKANVPFSWKALKDDSYIYGVDGIKYTLDFSGSDEEDNFEVGPDAFVEVESNINKALEKRQLCLVHTHTGDQTADYVLTKTDFIDKLKEIFPNSEDLQFFVDNKKGANKKSFDQEVDEEFMQYKQGSYFNKLKFRWSFLGYIHNPIAKVIFLLFGESETSRR